MKLFRIMTLLALLTISARGAGYLPAGSEIVQLRTEYARQFDNGDGTITAEVHVTPIHQRGEAGDWVPVDAFYKAELYRGASTGWVSDSLYRPMMGNPVNVKAKGTGDIRWGYKYYNMLNPEVNKVWHGWAKYSLAGIPPEAVITNAVAHYYALWPPGAIGAKSVMTVLEADPMTLGAEALWNSIITSKVIGVPHEDRRLLWVEVHFNEDGLTHLEAGINRGWAAFGHGYAEQRGGVIDRGCLVYGHDRRDGLPYIEITYHTVGVEEPTASMPVPAPHLTITPNPVANGSATLRFHAIREGDALQGRLKLFDTQGRVISDRLLDAANRSTGVSLDLSDFPTGTYLVRFENAEFSASGRLLVLDR